MFVVLLLHGPDYPEVCFSQPYEGRVNIEKSASSFSYYICQGNCNFPVLVVLCQSCHLEFTRLKIIVFLSSAIDHVHWVYLEDPRRNTPVFSRKPESLLSGSLMVAPSS